jgi:hypothetical protein
MIAFSRSYYVWLFSMFSNANFCSLVDKWKEGRIYYELILTSDSTDIL